MSANLEHAEEQFKITADTEEGREVLRAHENDILQQLVSAAGYRKQKVVKVVIERDEGAPPPAFRIRPLDEREWQKARRKYWRYERTKFGTKVLDPEKTDNARLNSALIYEATIEEDRQQLWDNKAAWEALRGHGIDVTNPLDMIDAILLAGEKDAVVAKIEAISGYRQDLEDTAGN